MKRPHEVAPMKRKRSTLAALWCFSLAIASAAALAAPCWGQGAPAGPLRPKPGVEPEKEPPAEQQKHAIRTRVSVVTTPVTVRDPRTGDMVLDLSEDKFHVYDNGVEQKINHFDLGGDPLSVVLVAETSSHVQAMLPAIRK